MQDQKEKPSDRLSNVRTGDRESGAQRFYNGLLTGPRRKQFVMAAMYRFNYDGWNYGPAYEQMKNYDFYMPFGHGALKKQVEDYWQRFQTKGPHPG